MKTWMLLAVLSLGVASVDGFFSTRAVAADTAKKELSKDEVKTLFEKQTDGAFRLETLAQQSKEEKEKVQEEIEEYKKAKRNHEEDGKTDAAKAAEKKITELEEKIKKTATNNEETAKKGREELDKVKKQIEDLSAKEIEFFKKPIKEHLKDRVTQRAEAVEDLILVSDPKDNLKQIVQKVLKGEALSAEEKKIIDKYEAMNPLQNLKAHLAVFDELTSAQKAIYEKIKNENPVPVLSEFSLVPQFFRVVLAKIEVNSKNPKFRMPVELKKAVEKLEKGTLEISEEQKDLVRELELLYYRLAPRLRQSFKDEKDLFLKNEETPLGKAFIELEESKTKIKELEEKKQQKSKDIEELEKNNDKSMTSSIRQMKEALEEISKQLQELQAKVPELQAKVDAKLKAEEPKIIWKAYQDAADKGLLKKKVRPAPRYFEDEEEHKATAEVYGPEVYGPIEELMEKVMRPLVEGNMEVAHDLHEGNTELVAADEASKIERRAAIQDLENNVMATYSFLVEQTKLMNEIHDRLRGAKLGARTNFYKAVNNMKKVEYGPIKEVGRVDLQELSKPEMADIPEYVRLQAYNLQDLYYKYKRTEAVLAAMLDASKQKQFKMFAPVLEAFMQELAARTDGDHAVGNIAPVFAVLKGNLLNQKKAQLAKLQGKKGKKNKKAIRKLTDEIAALEGKAAPTDSKNDLQKAEKEVKGINKKLEKLNKKKDLTDDDKKEKAKLEEELLVAKRTVNNHEDILGVAKKTYTDEDLKIGQYAPKPSPEPGKEQANKDQQAPAAGDKKDDGKNPSSPEGGVPTVAAKS